MALFDKGVRYPGRNLSRTRSHERQNTVKYGSRVILYLFYFGLYLTVPPPYLPVLVLWQFLLANLRQQDYKRGQ